MTGDNHWKQLELKMDRQEVKRARRGSQRFFLEKLLLKSSVISTALKGQFISHHT